ncbi:MAG: hypothetical protein JWM59_2379 [Verrucomicrobiales bacterium]|nr:hypothetical protein [Verrucomicrobiales bacterium]
MGKLLDLKFTVDHRLLSVVNMWRTVKALRLSGAQKAALRRTDAVWRKSGKGSCLICGNGPSLGELSFEDFSSTPAFAANYFYKHPQGDKLNPKHYVIIDGKITEGIWPVTMIDEIFATFPETSLFLDVRWLELPVFAPYVKNERIFWIYPALFPHAFLKPRRRLDQPLYALNVVSAIISLSTAMGYTGLGIAGVDGDGLFREILDMQSHFYAGDKDHSMRNFESMVKSLMLSTENLWAWQGIVKTHRAQGIHLENLCKGGIMDCMPRVSPADFLAAGKN